MVAGLPMPGAVMAVAAMLGAELTPGGVVAVTAMLAGVVLVPGAVVAVTAMVAGVVLIPGAVVAVAAVVARNEDEGAPGDLVPGTVPAGMATGMRLMVARTVSRRFAR